tara:strand:- start:7374 stop:8102 length:729 start_codon:yes stop_codon:yes gene_type:complete
MKLEDLKKAYKVPLDGVDRSQDGENRVLNHIFKELKITPKYAVEFGAGQVNDGRGTANISWFYNQYKCECIFFEAWEKKYKQSSKKYKPMIKMESISAVNVNEIFEKYNVPKDLDIVVIDVDGQDYWIWEKLKYEPKVLMIEFNPHISIEEDKVMHYDPDHWEWRDTNCAYCGASIGALKKLGEKKGYSCVFRTRRNLVFVKKEYIDIDIPKEELFNLYTGNKEKNHRTVIRYKEPQWVTIK